MKYLFLLASLFLSTAVVANDIPPPPTLATKAFLLRDYNSGNILAQQNANERVEPASLTKLMTAYLTFKALKNGHLQLTQTLPVSVKAWKAEGSRMFIEPNNPVTVDELLHGMIIVSGNDASIALAEGIGSSEEIFADMMNKEAARLGMKNTHFMNATGMPDANHYTTAFDLSLLASALIHDFPDQYKRLYAIKEYCYPKTQQSSEKEPTPTTACLIAQSKIKASCYSGLQDAKQPKICQDAKDAAKNACIQPSGSCAGITQPNRNRLLWTDPFVDGMKTGHTESAGYCLISSAKRADTRLISIVLGTPSDTARAMESQKLLNYGFQFFESRLFYKRGQTVSTLKVWKGANNTLAATVADDLYVTLPKGQTAGLKAQVISKQPLIAPIAAGQEIGTVQFTQNGTVVFERKLVAAREMPVAGLFGRLWDSIKLMFQ